MANPQTENGYTKISNELLEAIIRSGLNGTEIAIIFHIIRKTYGFSKLEDEISLSQFCESIPVSRMSIITALKNLQLVKIIRLVKKGLSVKMSNRYAINKNYEEWQLVKKTRLVKISSKTSKDFYNKLVKKTLHTKENIQKKYTKEIYIEKKENFKIPKIEEIKSYCLERKNNINPVTFFNYYESKGWMIGKNKMKNWKACIHTWEEKHKEDKPSIKDNLHYLN